MKTAPESLEKVRSFEKVCAILEKYDHDSGRLIKILQDVQHEYRYLPKEVMTYLATALRVSPAHIYGVATFYHHFALEPKGKYILKVCDGTACHVKGSGHLVEVLQKELQLTDKKNTTDDMLFTLETVSCLGACGLAPVMVVNEQVYGQVTAEKAAEIIANLKKSEGVS